MTMTMRRKKRRGRCMMRSSRIEARPVRKGLGEHLRRQITKISALLRVQELPSSASADADSIHREITEAGRELADPAGVVA